jgi:hypothetical protein
MVKPTRSIDSIAKTCIAVRLRLLLAKAVKRPSGLRAER